MAEKLTITVPDDLYKRLQEVKDRFNISGVCQDAIESEVNRHETLLKFREGDTMENAIERLRAEKEEYIKQYHDQGYSDGFEVAKSMEYGELIAVRNNPRTSAIYQLELWDNWLKDQTDDLLRDDAGFDTESYIEGWVQGVIAFFDEVQDRL